MADYILGDDEIQASESGRARGTTQPMTVVRPLIETGDEIPLAHVHRPSYHPTRWPFVNRVLDIVERVSGGHAGLVQRVFNYLMFGGFAALVNLTIVTVIYYHVALPVDKTVHFAIAFIVATEVSIITNFIPQDLVTFSHLPGHSRSRIVRCMRFHMTSVGGVIVTAAVSFSLKLLGFHVTLAQAIAIVVALFFNFTFHHLFTYRHTKPQVL